MVIFEINPFTYSTSSSWFSIPFHFFLIVVTKADNVLIVIFFNIFIFFWNLFNSILCLDILFLIITISSLVNIEKLLFTKCPVLSLSSNSVIFISCLSNFISPFILSRSFVICKLIALERSLKSMIYKLASEQVAIYEEDLKIWKNMQNQQI